MRREIRMTACFGGGSPPLSSRVLCAPLRKIRNAGRGTQMNECSFEHIDFISSEMPPLKILNRYFDKWALECVKRFRKEIQLLKALVCSQGFKIWGWV